MKKSKTYERAYFSVEVLKEAYNVLVEDIAEEDRERVRNYLTVETENAEWRYDSEEEFFSDYRTNAKYALYDKTIPPDTALAVRVSRMQSKVEVQAPTRSRIEAVFDVFEKHLAEATVPETETPVVKPTVFVGHGRSPQWRDLKDHLHEQHGYEVVAYEVGARAGHTIRDILDDMLGKSSFAILVMSAEDKDAEGRFHARPNVIHELGLFQGRLGFSRAIVLLEEGTDEFSNIHGIQQIRYGRNNIRETYGDVLATLRREFDSR